MLSEPLPGALTAVMLFLGSVCVCDTSGSGLPLHFFKTALAKKTCFT